MSLTLSFCYAAQRAFVFVHCRAMLLVAKQCTAVLALQTSATTFVWCIGQEADVQPAAHVATGVPMTDLERQFFANSQPDDSSDSSSDSDQESMNAASEDDEDDGLDHF